GSGPRGLGFESRHSDHLCGGRLSFAALSYAPHDIADTKEVRAPVRSLHLFFSLIFCGYPRGRFISGSTTQRITCRDTRPTSSAAATVPPRTPSSVPENMAPKRQASAT